MKLAVAIAVGAAAAGIAATPARAQQKEPAEWRAFTASLDAYARADRIVGASAVFVQDGRIVARHAFGAADAATGRPVDERTIFHWGSITKTIGAAAVMQLRDRGRLSLDDPVLRWIPELRQVHDPFGAADSITIRHLLSHSAGYQSPTWPWTDGAEWEPFEPTRWDQLVAMMPYMRLQFRPGSRYGYSNPAYVYLARIVEAASGDPWQSYVQKNVFTPLGLTRSYFGGTPYHLAGDRSHGYYVRRDSTGRDSLVDVGADFDPGITIPNGGWNAPIDEVARWMSALMGTTDFAVLPAETRAEMWTPVVDVGPDPGTGAAERMGLGLFVVDSGGRRFVGHTGTQAGYRSWMRFEPATRRGFVIVVNTSTLGRGGPAPELITALRAAQRLFDAKAPTSLVDVRMNGDAAAAALDYARSVRQRSPDAAAWRRLTASEGYRRLHRREAAMGRAFTDSSFRSFLESDTLGARVRDLERTVADWRAADIRAAAARAFDYLPDGARLDAVVYPMVKPRTNSFVFDLATDSAAIFLYVDPAVSRAKLENTLAHELHHVGIAAACAGTEPDPGLAPEVIPAVRWMGAFAEGIAVLAAAGGPDADPHLASDPAERARWARDYANAPADVRALERFFLDVIEGRLPDEPAQRERAAPFWGDAQGAWYTVGYLMATTVERAEGRQALIATMCEPWRLLLAYERAAARAGDPGLPRWSAALLRHLTPGTR